MTTSNDAINRDDFSVLTMHAHGAFDQIHPSNRVRVAERCEPLHICERLRQLTEVTGEIEKHTNLCNVKASSCEKL